MRALDRQVDPLRQTALLAAGKLPDTGLAKSASAQGRGRMFLARVLASMRVVG